MARLRKDVAVLLYSGGLDSTCQAIEFIKKYDEVHLVTFELPYCIMNNNSRRALKELKSINPECKVFFRKIRIGNVFLDSFYDDYAKYCNGGAPGIVCLGCRIAMIESGIRYCLKNGIYNMGTGHTINQVSKAHSYPKMLKRFISLMNSYGISYDNTIYHISSRKKEEERLKENGIGARVSFGQSNFLNEPRCIIGPVTSLWMMSESLDESKMLSFYDDYEASVKKRIGINDISNKKVKNNFDLNLLTRRVIPSYEFSRRTDSIIGIVLSPLWFFFKIFFRFRTKRLESNK